MNEEAKNNAQEQLTEEKTFTQEQVNNIIGERLAKERAKTETVLAEKEKELNRRELVLSAREKLSEAGLSTALVEALNMSNQEALEKSLSIIKETIDKAKEESKRPIRITGTVPAGPSPVYGNEPDRALRKAMGLSY